MTVETPINESHVFEADPSKVTAEMKGFEEVSNDVTTSSALITRIYHGNTGSDDVDPLSDRVSINLITGEEVAELFPTDTVQHQFMNSKSVMLSLGSGFEYFGRGSSSTIFSRDKWREYLVALNGDQTKGVTPSHSWTDANGDFIHAPLQLDLELLNSDIYQIRGYGRGNDPTLRNYTARAADSERPGDVFNRWTGDLYQYRKGKLTTFIKSYDASGVLYNGVVSIGSEDISSFGSLDIYADRQSDGPPEGVSASIEPQYIKDFGSQWPALKLDSALCYDGTNPESKKGINTDFPVNLKGEEFKKRLRQAGVTTAASLNPNNAWTTRDYIDKFNYVIGDTITFHGQDPKLTLGPIATVNICSAFPYDWVMPSDTLPNDKPDTTWNNSDGFSSKTIGNTYSYHLGKRRDIFKTKDDGIWQQDGWGPAILKWKGHYASLTEGDAVSEFLERGSHFFYNHYDTHTSTQTTKLFTSTTNTENLKFNLSAVGVTSSLTVAAVSYFHIITDELNWFAGPRAAKAWKGAAEWAKKKLGVDPDEETELKTVVKQFKKEITFQKNDFDAVFANVSDSVAVIKNDLKAQQAAIGTDIAAIKTELKANLADVENKLNEIDSRLSSAKTGLVKQSAKAVTLTQQVSRAEAVLCKPKAGWFSWFF
ncbi:MAG: hypothetical protein HN763_05340 [Opitutales bacterium]|nr:hypothetical protein [Opitutales bacterium]